MQYVQGRRNEITTAGARANTVQPKNEKNGLLWYGPLKCAGARAPAAPAVPTPLTTVISS